MPTDPKSDTNTLTAIVLCLNAAETLPDCLESLKFCDEVIVADDGSTDGSIEVAKKYGAKVISLSPDESFAHKRNQAVAAVKSGWVLYLDSDEVVTKELGDQIKRALTYTDADGFFIARRDFFLGKQLEHGETGSMWLLRLARANRGEWKRTVHEVWEVTGRVIKLNKGVILHHPHPTVASFIDTLNHYTDLEVKERSKQVSLASAWIQLFIFPEAKFIQNYIFRLGFLDGIQGFIHAYCMSLHSLLTRIKILEYVRNQ